MEPARGGADGQRLGEGLGVVDEQAAEGVFAVDDRLAGVMVAIRVDNQDAGASRGKPKLHPSTKLVVNQRRICSSSVVALCSQAFMAGSLVSVTGKTGQPRRAKPRAA